MATRALILDESTGVRTLFSRILRSLNCASVEAADGSEAIDALEQSDFDLAIFDLDAQVLSGVDLLQAVRTSERYASLPVVIITDGADQGAIAEVVKLGASDCLTKPFEVDMLRTRLQRVIKNLSAVVQKPVAATTPGATGSALIVDHNADFRHFVANVLMSNYATLQAETGLEALRLCELRPPSVLVLGDDTGLLAPRLLARRLRRNQALDDMRIVLVAAKNGASDIVDPMAFDAILTRTFVPAEFAAQFQQIFSRTATGEDGVIEDIRKTVVSATEQALGMMASTEVSLVDDSVVKLPAAELEALSVMKLQMERVAVRLTLTCDTTTARRLAAKMMGTGEDEVSAEDGLSGLGEMVNVIAGRVKSAISNEGGSMSFSIPELRPADPAAPPHTGVALAFASSDHDVALTVLLTRVESTPVN